jgi:hypothetical protein
MVSVFCMVTVLVFTSLHGHHAHNVSAETGSFVVVVLKQLWPVPLNSCAYISKEYYT